MVPYFPPVENPVQEGPRLVESFLDRLHNTYSQYVAADSFSEATDRIS